MRVWKEAWIGLESGNMRPHHDMIIIVKYIETSPFLNLVDVSS